MPLFVYGTPMCWCWLAASRPVYLSNIIISCENMKQLHDSCGTSIVKHNNNNNNNSEPSHCDSGGLSQTQSMSSLSDQLRSFAAHMQGLSHTNTSTAPHRVEHIRAQPFAASEFPVDLLNGLLEMHVWFMLVSSTLFDPLLLIFRSDRISHTRKSPCQSFSCVCCQSWWWIHIGSQFELTTTALRLLNFPARMEFSFQNRSTTNQTFPFVIRYDSHTPPLSVWLLLDYLAITSNGWTINQSLKCDWTFRWQSVSFVIRCQTRKKNRGKIVDEKFY